ncbi:MAG: hypothetical protein M1830_010392 [Pleopsidium flavum]|nr:MAG: hypothetical protein M1830_010392 [Pleopsidium flavum]
MNAYLTAPRAVRRRLSEESFEGRPGRRRSTHAEIALQRILQDHPNANPATASRPQYHTGRLPNSKLGDNKPRLLLMGQKRSGKSSISSVVFHKMPANETLFLESTTRIQKDSMHSFMDFQVWDFPGQLDFLDPVFDLDAIFGEIGALIWVIDAQDDYFEAVTRLNGTILNLQQSYPNINIEVFVHKVDCLSDEFRQDTYRDIIQRVTDDLSDAGYENAPVSFYMTSIYNHSIFEAFSKVIQKLIPQLPTLESLLNILTANCHMEKAYLFDVLSKIYIASDTSPINMQSYTACSDYIDAIVDVSEIYGWDRPEKEMTQRDVDIASQDAESFVALHDGSLLYLMEINKYLALIGIVKDPKWKEKKGLIDYNVSVFQEGMNEVFARS